MPERAPERPRETWIIFSEELRRHARSRWYLISTVVVVVLLVLATAVVPSIVNRGGSKTPSGQELTKVGYIDETGSFSSLGGQNGPQRFTDTAQGVQALAGGTIDYLFVIPQGYLTSGKVQEYGQFKGRFPSNPTGEAAFNALLVDGLLAGRVQPDVKARVLTPAIYETLRVSTNGKVSSLPPMNEVVAGFLIPLMFAGLLGMGLTAGGGTMVQSVSEEKESRLVEVVVTSASPFSLMAGKLLALAAVGLGQMAVWIVVTALTVPGMFRRIPSLGAFHASAGLWLLIVCCVVVGYFLITALALLVAAIAPTSREASGMGSWVSLVAFVPIWFSGLLIAQPDGLASRIISYFPFTAPTGILVRRSAGGEIATWQIAASLVGVAVMGLIVLWIATRVFRAAILMRGQSFTSRHLWAALRGAE